MTALAILDLILYPLDRLARIFIVVLLVAVAVLATDREPPFAVLSVQPAAARAGDIVIVRAKVRRDTERGCSATFVRYVTDSESTRWLIDHGNASSAMIAHLEKRSPGTLALAVRVPYDARPGPAEMETVLDYACNKTHYVWPIQVTTQLGFTVLPP